MDNPEGMKDVLLGLVDSYNAANMTVNECDYTGEDGLLHCGICGEPKEYERDVTLYCGEIVKKKVFRCCSCEREVREKRLMEREKEEAARKAAALRAESIMDTRLREARFDVCETNDYNRKNIEACKRYASNFKRMLETNQGLLFWGDVGTGKSFSAACIVNELLNNGVSAIMTSFVRLMNMEDKTEFETVIRRLSMCKLAVIDDLGAERRNTYALERVYHVVDSRYTSKLPMIVTTNLALKDMLEEEDEYNKRIYDRILEACYPIQWSGPSWRRTQARTRFNEMKELLGV